MISESPVSVIIPTLNEERCILTCIEPLKDQEISEIIISDGGSEDKTLAIVESLKTKYPGKIKVIISEKGRGVQMNTGARVASGRILWFLHADSVAPLEAVRRIKKELKRGAIGGAFRFGIIESGIGFRIIECGARVRNWLFNLPYGDQGYFVTKDIFEQLKGFPEIEIMEDAHFYRKLKSAGTTAHVPLTLLTSARRWQTEGLIKTTVKHLLLLCNYFSRTALLHTSVCLCMYLLFYTEDS